MSKSKHISGAMVADGDTKVAVIVGRFNSFIVDQLEAVITNRPLGVVVVC